MMGTKELPEVDIDFFINGRMYRIAPSSLHGLELFSMDGIKFEYGTVTELMECVGPLLIRGSNFSQKFKVLGITSN